MSLEKLRQEIDELDGKLVEMLNQRARVSLMIWQEKQKHHLPIFNPQREHEVLQQVMQINTGPLSSEQMQAIFQLIIQSCRTIQLQQKGQCDGHCDER